MIELLIVISFKGRLSHITVFIYTASGILNLSIPQSITGKQLKKLVLNRMKSSNSAFDDHLLYKNQCIDIERPIGILVPHNSSISLQAIGKGGGKESKKQKPTIDIQVSLCCVHQIKSQYDGLSITILLQMNVYHVKRLQNFIVKIVIHLAV